MPHKRMNNSCISVRGLVMKRTRQGEAKIIRSLNIVVIIFTFIAPVEEKGFESFSIFLFTNVPRFTVRRQLSSSLSVGCVCVSVFFFKNIAVSLPYFLWLYGVIPPIYSAVVLRSADNFLVTRCYLGHFRYGFHMNAFRMIFSFHFIH